MTESPTVSIIIPCYEQAQFLGAAIESARQQTYTRIEIVVVDDGSSDDTAGLIAQRSGVRYVRQDNRGLSEARNTGMRTSVGELLVFLDADDRLLPGAVEAGVDCASSHPECAFVSGHWYARSSDGTVETIERRTVDGDHYEELLRHNYIGMHAAVMYRREPLQTSGGFDPALAACEDYDLFLRLAREHPLGQHKAVVAEYLQHEANMSNDPALMLRSALRVLRRQSSFVAERPRYRRAYADGVRAWKEYYSRELFARGIVQWRLGERRRALQSIAIAGLHAPRIAGSAIACKLVKLLHPQGSGPGKKPPPVGKIRFGDLHRTRPISRTFGFDRGKPVDRYYIEGFLARRAADVRGHVLEIGDNIYTYRFGGTRVARSDVLDVREGNPAATLVGNLEGADHISSSTFDCILLTQTLHLIYDVRAALRTLHRILKPGGVLLATFPGISHRDEREWASTWYWSFTSRSVYRLFEELFGDLEVEAHGNVLAATAFLQGIAAEELKPAELDEHDPQYEMLIAVRAVKA